MARLVVINHQALAGSTFELGGNWTTIGRANGNAYQIVESSVSARHCEVRVQGEELRVRDLISTNGTFIAGQKISEGVAKPGQVLRLGNMELRYEASTAVASGATFNSKKPATNGVATLVPGAASAPPPPPPPPVSVDPTVAEGDAGKKFKVLFVDDSLSFLELFGGLCAEFAKGSWQVHTATSADRALAMLAEQSVDLAVLDVNMPMLDGLQLLGIINRRHPGIKIAMLTGNATEAKRADALTNGAELFLEKPVDTEGMRAVFNMLNDLISWRHEGFTGTLRQVGLTEIVQMECNGRHSSILEIRNHELRGQVYIEDGVVTHAAIGTLVGERAFYRLMSLKGGEFQVKPFKMPPQRTIENRWEFLLMDAARADDEETDLNKHSATAASDPSSEKKEHATLGDDVVVVATYDGEWKPEAEKK